MGRGGVCVALTDLRGSCVIVHAQLGADQKPKACQLYPFRFLRTPTGVRVGLSFSCPAGVDAEGPLLREQEEEIRALYERVAGSSMLLVMGDEIALSDAQKLPWRDAETLLAEISATFAADGTLVERLARAGATAALVAEALDHQRPFADALAQSIAERERLVSEALARPPEIDGLSRSLFRTLVKASELGHVSALGRSGQTMGAWLGRGQLRRRRAGETRCDRSIGGRPRPSRSRSMTPASRFYAAGWK